MQQFLIFFDPGASVGDPFGSFYVFLTPAAAVLFRFRFMYVVEMTAWDRLLSPCGCMDRGRRVFSVLWLTSLLSYMVGNRRCFGQGNVEAV